jgi:eukaryotic-like serine/threonine-protein kinase
MGSKELDHRSDLWSVGVVVFEALSGIKPFDAETIGALTMRIHHTPHPKPSDKIKGAGAALDAWFAKACALHTNERFNSAKALSEALTSALSGSENWTLTSASLPSGPVARSSSGTVDYSAKTLDASTMAPSESKTGRSKIALLLAGALVLAAGSGYAIWASSMHDPFDSGGAAVPAIRSEPRATSASAPPPLLASAPPQSVTLASLPSAAPETPSAAPSLGPRLPWGSGPAASGRHSGTSSTAITGARPAVPAAATAHSKPKPAPNDDDLK